MFKFLTVGCLIALVFCPIQAHADVGTPLVWAGAFHLLIGNALIGIGEGWLLARVFRLAKGRCVWLMIIANYLSAWVGAVLGPYWFQKYGADIYAGFRVMWMLVAMTYLLTLVIEWPFVALCFRTVPGWFAKSVKGSLLVQSASYVLLFGGYWFLSGTSLYTGMKVVRPEQMSPPRGIVMFFISSSDGDVYKKELGRPMDTMVAKLGSTNYYDDHLELKESATASNRWDLAAVFERRNVRVVVPGIASRQSIPEEQGWKTGRYYGWGDAFQVGDATNSDWRIWWAHWPDVGMWARGKSETVRIAYGTPLGGYAPYRVVQLPGDMALLQLDDQICLVDLSRRTIARIRKGYGMLAFEKDEIADPPGVDEQQPKLKLHL